LASQIVQKRPEDDKPGDETNAPQVQQDQNPEILDIGSLATKADLIFEELKVFM
jgi:hypothetical protein